MNKTVSINLNGMLFNLEEGAYSRLFNYLNEVRKNFAETDGGNEIVLDIEARIAELFAQYIKHKQVILEKEVEEVIAIMGEPEVYSENEIDSAQAKKNKEIPEKETVKRLYRDSDDAVLGGVCSGIAYYFGIDPVWLRLAFVIALFLAGSGPLLYIILWIVIPKANSTAEKLQMRGEKVNIENIERRIREEAKIFKERAQAFGEDASKGFRKANVHGRLGEFISEISGIFMNAFRRILLFMGKSIGIIFIVLGAILFFLLLSLLFSGGNMISIQNNAQISSFSIQDFLATFFTSQNQCNVFLVGIMLIILSPILGLLTGGFRLLFHPNLRLNWMRTINSLILISGLICCIVSGSLLLREFSSSGKMIENVKLSKTSNDTLNIAIQPGSEINLKKSLKLGHWNFYFNDGERFINGRIQVNIDSTEEINYIITGERNARGTNNKQAIENASSINYFYRQIGNTLYFNPYFNLKQNTWRNQQVTMNIYIPQGKFVSFKNGTEQILNNITSKENYDNDELLNETFQMTNDGLQCVSCIEVETE
jgi:phage shock protein PspC (stress-responsive transcriptional regulator)